MKRPRLTLPLPNRGEILIGVSLMILAIALIDWVVENPWMGFLYFFPIIFTAEFLGEREVVAFAATCAILEQHFGVASWDPALALRFVTSLINFVGIGLLVSGITARRSMALSLAGRLAAQEHRLSDAEQGRQAAEEQLHSLVEGSPAAILTIDAQGRVILANDAAHEMLGFESQSLPGQLIDEYLPAVAALRETRGESRLVRTSLECTGRRRTGEAFLAQVWVSTFGTREATGLSVVLFDNSEEMRHREEGHLQTLTASARVIMGSFWHETRNVCTAMRMTANSLKLIPGVEDSEEIVAMTSLVEGLERLAVAELKPESEQSQYSASLRVVLDHLRIVIERWFQELQIRVSWSLADNLPLVRGDQHAILQVFMNLARNASRVLEAVEQKQFSVDATVEGPKVLVRFRNSGPPVSNPELLFKPFQPEAAGRGIGLYVSRAIMRSYGGDLRYEPASEGSCFTVVLERGATWYMFKS
jgi:two-component system, LuxR family, sensor kinase FixL